MASVLDRLDGFASAREVRAELVREGSSVALATVYRNLHVLARAGVVDTLRGDDGEVRYRALRAPDDRHLVCRDCGHAVEVPGGPISAWASEVGSLHGFTDPVPVVAMSGACGDSPRSARGNGNGSHA